MHVQASQSDDRELIRRAIAAAYVDRYVISDRDCLTVKWPADYTGPCKLAFQIRQPPSRVFAYSPSLIAAASAKIETVKPFELAEGAYQLHLMPETLFSAATEVHPGRDIPVYLARNRFVASPDDTPEERIAQAAQWVAQQVDDPFAQIASMALGRWDLVRQRLMEEALARAQARPAEDAHTLLGLIGACRRFGGDPAFPTSLRRLVRECALGCDYRIPAQASEGDEICLTTAELLAGEFYPRATFVATGRKGKWHHDRARRRVGDWLRQRGRQGFADWNDGSSSERIVVALTHLVDLAGEEDLQELAGVLLDKLFFSLALHNHRGVSGAARRRVAVPQVFGARLDPLAGITRLLWGQGVFNVHLAGVVSLLCVRNYVLPELIARIACDLPESAEIAERHVDPATGREANLFTYKTPDYMLASVQDYYPGEPGAGEHVWQATLSPDAVVFTSHPATPGLEPLAGPNFWCGNAILPRVAQYRNALIALYELPDGDRLGYTHAYFPAFAFDRHDIATNWAFACRGDAYLALTASTALRWVTTGDSAYRELVAEGQRVAWFCYLDRKATHGTYGDFIDKVLGMGLQFGDLSVECVLPEGQKLSFGHRQPLLVDGHEQVLSQYPHYRTPYGNVALDAGEMEIHLAGDGLRLNLA